MGYYKLKGMDGENVLILGGMGAIGSNIAHDAVKLGANVTIYDNFMESTGANPTNIREIKEKVNVIKGDIRDFDLLVEVIKDKTIIFNCAAQVSHVLSMQNPFLDIDINCVGHINVLEACRKFNDSVKIIYTGTRSQFGIASKLPLDEECRDNPTDVYSANKLASELYHLIYHKAYGMLTTSIRLTNTYGPRAQLENPSYNVVNWLIGRALLDKDLTVFEPGTQLRDINYVQDVVDALFLAVQNKKSFGEVFVLGTGKRVSFKEIAETIVKIAGLGRVKLVPWPTERKNIETGDIVIDYSKINKMIGWYPKTALNDGLKRTISFYRENLNDYLG